MDNIKIDIPIHFLEEEVRWDYTISPVIKKVWAVEIDLICELERVCQKHGLKFFACAGTALGVERHRGFIPWDDDVDLMMMRSDFEKLLQHKNEFKHPYFLQHQSTDPAFMYGFAKLQNLETTAIEQPLSPSKQGIFIDIFPLDSVPDNEDDLKQFELDMEVALRRMQMVINSTYNYYPEASSSSILFFKKQFHFFFDCLGLFSKLGQRMAKKFDKICSRYNNSGSNNVSMLAFQPSSRKYHTPRKFYENIEYKQFEFIELPVLAEDDSYLTHIFGDYMKPVRGSSFHEGIFFDPSNPYTKYIKSEK